MITTCFAESNPLLTPNINIAMATGPDDAGNFQNAPTSIAWGEALDLECRDMNTTELQPLQSMAVPAHADAFYYVRSNFEIGAHRLSRGFFNSSSFRPNLRLPSLHRTLEGPKTSNASFAHDQTDETGTNAAFVNPRAFAISNELVVQTSGIQVIDVLIHNFDDGNHPMHLHGYKYFVLASGYGSPPRLDPFRGPDRANTQPLYNGLDLGNPMRKDTASVEAFGWLLIRFVAGNPGLWSLHCHISWHNEAGLLTQFGTPTDLLRGLEIPDEQRALCQADGVEKGRAPSDEEYALIDDQDTYE